MSRPRVLLVDDDATLRRLVAMVLEELDVELIGCASVAEARTALQQAPVQLVITDLMMPTESGHVLLDELQAQPGLRAGAKLVVFSAGLDADARALLAARDVWRLLSKPSGVRDIEDCVREAIWGPAAPAAEAASSPADFALSAAEQQAVVTYFAGSSPLFLDYRKACVQQFGDDLSTGERVLQQGDLAALRRLAHNLKSVLRMLGEAAGASQAAEMENLAAAGDAEAAAARWPAVVAACRALQARAAG